MKHSATIFALMLTIALSGPAPALADEAEDAALEVAQSWLTLIDDGRYGESWDRSAEIFKSAITRENWEKALEKARKPHGEPASRIMTSAEYTTSLPGAPGGEFVVIHFTTTFEDERSVIERVTPTRGADGAWRVGGYFIK